MANKDDERHVNELIVDIFNRILSLEENYHQIHGSELSINEIHSLDAIQKSPTKKMSDVAQDLEVTQGTFSTTIRRLQDKGYVKKVQDELDRRIYRLVLTKSSDEVLKVHNQFHKEMVDSILDKSDESLILAIEKLNAFFKKLTNEQKSK